jgi:histidinol dehydrogenase
MQAFLHSRTSLAQSVRAIVEEVRNRGDEAVAEFTEKFDKVKLSACQFRIPQEELKKAHAGLDNDLLRSLRKAIENVRRYQAEIFIGNKITSTGIRYRPLQRVGVCIPGASAPLPSTVIMTAVPAQVAGVRDIVVVSPPRYQGGIHPVILGLCFELGITEVYRLGGAHAVAALAWGTQTIRKVDKIVGPGHDVVQLAKKEVYGLVDIDSFAGPQRCADCGQRAGKSGMGAADMLSQAEHDPGAGILVTASEKLAETVLAELENQVAQLGRSEATRACLLAYSGIVVLKTMEDVINWANAFAAEHLQVQCGDQSKAVSAKIIMQGLYSSDPTRGCRGRLLRRAKPYPADPPDQQVLQCTDQQRICQSSSIIEFDARKLADRPMTLSDWQ